VKKFSTAGQVTYGNKIRCMRIACWIVKATNTPTKYVTLIVFVWQPWLQGLASLVCYNYIACLFFMSMKFSLFPWGNNTDRELLGTGGLGQCMDMTEGVAR